MRKNLLLVSNKEDDKFLARLLQHLSGFHLYHALNREQLRALLVGHNHTAVLWDADPPAKLEEEHRRMSDILHKYVKPHRLFAVSDAPLIQRPDLLRNPVFGHHFTRRLDSPLPEILARLMEASLHRDPTDLELQFPLGTSVRSILITRTSHKAAAIEALSNSLKKSGVRGRLAGLVAQTVDELLLNAIFHAPVLPGGERFRSHAVRDLDFQLEGRELVELHIGIAPGYLVLAVTDLFGSWGPLDVWRTLRARFIEQKPTGLGLVHALESGLSLAVATNKKHRTQVIVYCPIVEQYKEFRQGFRFLSLLMPS